MPYITSVEQIGYDRGQVVGYDRGVREADQRLLEAQRSLLVRQLTRKIGPMPISTIDRINTVSIDQLESLGGALFDID